MIIAVIYTISAVVKLRPEKKKKTKQTNTKTNGHRWLSRLSIGPTCGSSTPAGPTLRALK